MVTGNEGDSGLLYASVRDAEAPKPARPKASLPVGDSIYVKVEAMNDTSEVEEEVVTGAETWIV